MSKGKMRKRGKDRIHHKKWVEIGKCVGKIAYFGAFWANIMTWRHKDRSKDRTRLKISTKTGAKTGFTRKSQQRSEQRPDSLENLNKDRSKDQTRLKISTKTKSVKKCQKTALQTVHKQYVSGPNAITR